MVTDLPNMDPFSSELLLWKKAFNKVIVDTLPENCPDFNLDIKYDTTAPLSYSPVYNLSKKENTTKFGQLKKKVPKRNISREKDAKRKKNVEVVYDPKKDHKKGC